MSVWSGLGVNYKSLVKHSIDMPYFKAIGLHNIRTHIPNYNSDNSNWRACASTFYTDPFFNVVYGISIGLSTPITTEVWASMVSAIEEEALYCQNNDICHEFQIGNEYEAHPGSDYTDAQMRDNIRALATSCQAIFTKGPISYSVSQGYLSGWISDNNLGDLDYLAINTYGNVVGLNTDPTNYTTKIPQVLNAFGAERCYISEFNLDPNNSGADIELLTKEGKEQGMRQMMNFIANSGMTRAMLFQYRGYNDSNNAFAVCKTDDSFFEYWNPLLTNNGRKTFIEV